MADPIRLIELELQVALLPPISRREHLVGPRLHAERLGALWRTDDDVPLADAFRLLDIAVIAGAILRLSVEIESADSRYWTFPELEELLPALRALAWEEILAGRLTVEGVAGVREGRRRRIPPVRLQRLTPDWVLSWLTRSGQDEFTDVRVRREAPRPPRWQKPPSPATMRTALMKIEKNLPPGAVPSEPDMRALLAKEMGRPISRQQVRDALLKFPHLKRTRGQRN